MAVQQMKLLNITFKKENIFDVLLQVKNNVDIYPQKANKFIHGTKDVKVYQKDSYYDHLYHRLQELSYQLGITLNDSNIDNENEQFDKDYVDTFLDQIEDEFNKINKVKLDLQRTREDNLNTLSMLENMEDENLNLDMLFRCKYLKVRVGYMPKENLEKLNYYDGYPFIYRLFKEESHYIWVIYIAIEKDCLSIDNIFSSLNFTRVKIPDYVHGTVNAGIKELYDENEAMGKYIEVMNQRIQDLSKRYEDKLNQLYAMVVRLKDVYELSDCIIDYSYYTSILCFVSTKDCQKVMKQFEQIPNINITVLPPNTYEAHSIVPPVILCNHPFIAPFEKLARVKNINDVDTTMLIALWWLIVAGIFFGDVVVGLLMMLIGVIFHRKSSLFQIMSRIGISIFGFGLLEGSIGYQTYSFSVMNLGLGVGNRISYGIILILLGQLFIQFMSQIIHKQKIRT